MTMFKFTAFRSLGLVSGLCLALLAPSTASALLIDNFDSTPQGVLSGVFPTAGPTAAPVLGGSRTLTAAGPFAAVAGSAGSGTLGLNLGTGGGGSVTATWDAFGAGLGGVSLSASGETGFTVFVITHDVHPNTVTISVTDTSAITGTVSALIPGGATGAFFLPFASFVGSPNLTLANFISLSLSGGTNADIEVDFFGSNNPVPEPSSLAIALTGLGFAGVYFRRRRKQLTA